MFICLEGIDGAGKTTQARLLANRLITDGHAAIQVADPGTTALGKAIRELVLERDEPITPLAQMLLFSSARAELSAFIKDQVTHGTSVVCDRWILSTLVYQAMDNKIEPEFILQIFAQTCIAPDLCFVLDIDPVQSEKRRAPSKDRFERRPLEDKKKMRQAYLSYASIARQCAKNTYVLNADVPEDVMNQAICDIVGQHLNLFERLPHAQNCAR
jgi:dTMP kinase